jgi:mRNA interferase MazF
MRSYIPQQGDLVALDFDPQSGHEQKGRWPAIVVSKQIFNEATGLAICCPITNTDRGVPFHVPLAGRSSLNGFVMCERVKSLDFRSRHTVRIESAPTELLNDVLALIDAAIF